MRPGLLCISFLLIYSLHSRAEEVKIVIVEFGEYESAEIVDDQKAKETTIGSVKVVNPYKDPQLKRQALFIKGEKGTRFGVKFRIEGFGSDPVPVKVRVVHPPVKKPGAEKASISETWDMEGSSLMPRYTGFSFDEEWEIARGEWFLQIFHQDKLKAEQRFVVE